VKKFYSLAILIVDLSLGGFFLRHSLTFAATPCDPWIAKMESVQGNVEVRRAGQTQWQPARLNDTYCPGDRIQVGERSRADIYLASQSVLRLNQSTTITLGGVREERTSLIELVRGALYFFSRLPRNLEFATAFVNAGVEGTEGLITVDAGRATVSIFEGKVLASNQFGQFSLTSGQSAVAEQGKAPVLTVVVRPRDAVQWAFYYPPTLTFRPGEFPTGAGWEGMVRNSIEAFLKGDLQAAFESIKGVPDTLAEARFFVYRASLLLAVGRFDEAGKDIERALSLNPKYSDAFALQSIVAVAQNDKEKALDMAQTAITTDGKSAAAHIALSYAQLANFNLEGALASLKQAVQLSPENALAWARLAELHLSFAELDAALEAAQKAVALDPNLSRTQTILGFAYLTVVDTTESKKAFEKAIELDQGDPLPRLGLGLVTIREGDLEEGRQKIDIAVSLDPDNSLMRSYLGKAYYEEKRDAQSATQYQMAKDFDPKDPTPYFYDAIRKQTTNRPVEALQDMQKAIELNDNRAVYRSRLLLDSDLAARSAALARIYTDLGFQQLGLVEGWKSVNTDPSNFSAHRFLADSYAYLPRHEIARVSELLQSQLLQPLNMTPIQPHLAESNLFLISAGGPTALSFNEFNPLFNRNGINFQTNSLVGGNNTYAGEGILSGIYKATSFSLGGFHFETDGWRRNADRRDSIGNAFVQFELSPDTSIQAEYRYRWTARGDNRLRFFPYNFFASENTDEERNTFRVGARHSFSPESVILGSFTYQDNQLTSTDTPLFGLFSTIKRPETSFGTEIQHIFRSQHVNVTSGVGNFDIHGKLDTNGVGQSLDLRHSNLYAYSYISPLKNLTVTIGGSGDFTRGDSPDTKNISQFNPKFGVTWSPIPNTTLRGAAFRVLKRTLVTDQTIEPTQVAGFNQFFDDSNGTSAWRYGGAIDQKFTTKLFGGVEYSYRDLEVPGINLPSSHWKEQLGRVYLFWTPHPWFAARAEYQYERVRRDGMVIDSVAKMDFYRVPLGINFFHPSGFSVFLAATYVNQEGKFQNVLDASIRSGEDQFVTVDAGIKYRLPLRYGFVALTATNLFDKKFKFFNTDINNGGGIQPDRLIALSFTLALP
jgi:tetratricopeptide (TPR) repeat protein